MNISKFAGTLIIQNGKILLVQEAHKEAYGLWSFPLGYVEKEEKESDTAIRETKEETGYDVILGNSKSTEINGKDFKSITNFNDDLIKLTIFNAKITNGVARTGDDVLNVKWFPLDELKNLPLRGNWLKDFLDQPFGRFR